MGKAAALMFSLPFMVEFKELLSARDTLLIIVLFKEPCLTIFGWIATVVVFFQLLCYRGNDAFLAPIDF